MNNTPESPNELLEVFVRFHQKWIIALRKEAKNLPLTIPQIETLRFVIENEDSTMKDVAKHLYITAPSATAMIEHLFAKKLARRILDPADRRAVHIVPTPKAIELFSSLKKFKAKVFNDMLKGLSTEDKKILTKILTKII